MAAAGAARAAMRAASQAATGGILRCPVAGIVGGGTSVDVDYTVATLGG